MVANVLGENTLGVLPFTRSGNGRRSSGEIREASLPLSPLKTPEAKIAFVIEF